MTADTNGPLSPDEQAAAAVLADLIATKRAERATRLRQAVRHTTTALAQLARSLTAVGTARRRLEDARRKRGASRRRSTPTRGSR